VIARLFSLFSRFRSDERGAFLVIFGVAGVVLIALSGAVVDYTSVQQARTRAQIALDAAALALQPQIYTKTAEQLRVLAEPLLLERLGEGNSWSVCKDEKTKPPCAKMTSVVTDTVNGVITLNATVSVPLYFVALVGVDHMNASMLSQATKGSVNVEVALALDTTGSMAGTKIKDLQDATKSLIDIVVKDTQTPTYSKVAIVPYSMGVNVGSYAPQVRGAVIGATAITDISWSNGAATVKSATKANPVVITTTAAHNFSTNDRIYISGVAGMTSINGIFTVKNLTSTTFSLAAADGSNVDGSKFTNYTSGGAVTRCKSSNCELVVTSAAHALANTELVYLTGINGMKESNGAKALNNNLFNILYLTANTYALSATFGGNYAAYTSSGSSFCTRYGCEYYYFRNAGSGTNYNLFRPSTCVSERTANAYTDAAPSTSALGMVYPPASGNSCLASTIIPLTIDKTALKAVATSLAATGSTAGHIGLAWAWYMLSPDFAYLWPAASKPAAYNTPKLLKAIVLMTDGDFNTGYCAGVISKDAGSGSGNASDHINCNAPNGSSGSQALSLCQAIKNRYPDNRIVIYTVGFAIPDPSAARTLMKDCATDAKHAYFAETGQDLKDIFKDIGENIAALRVTR